MKYTYYKLIYSIDMEIYYMIYREYSECVSPEYYKNNKWHKSVYKNMEDVLLERSWTGPVKPIKLTEEEVFLEVL